MPATTSSFTNNARIVATFQRRSKGYVDAITKQIPLFWWMREKKRYKPRVGGTSWDFQLEYQLDTTEASFRGYDTIIPQPSDNVTCGTANWKYYQKSVVISGQEKNENQGEKAFDLIEQKEGNALKSMQSALNGDLYLDGKKASAVLKVGHMLETPARTRLRHGVTMSRIGTISR